MLLSIHQTDRGVSILSKNEQAMAQASQIYKNQLTLATKKRLLSCAKEISFFVLASDRSGLCPCVLLEHRAEAFTVR
jgi:hypothetical protein